MQTRNLPLITTRYWVAILAASVCGANTGDFLARKLHLGHAHGLLPLAALFACILWAERRAQLETQAYYWLAIIAIRTAATNLADLATHDLGLSYGLVEPGLTVLLIAILCLDSLQSRSTGARDRLVGRQGSNLPKTNALYWAAMLTAGTLGTASGDYVARILGLGAGSIALGIIYGVVLMAGTRFGGMSIPWYWASIVAARTAGTTMGDFIARHQGLSSSTIFTGLVLASIVLLWRDKPAAERGEVGT